MYINSLQIYNSHLDYAHNSYTSNNFKRGISEYKGVAHCEGFDYEQSDDIMDASCLNPLHKESEIAS